MKKLNNYFFGEEDIHLYDALWFYGIYSVVIAITFGAIISFI